MKLKLLLTLLLALGCMTPAMIQSMETTQVITTQEETKPDISVPEQPTMYSFTKTQIILAATALGLICYYCGKFSKPILAEKIAAITDLQKMHDALEQKYKWEADILTNIRYKIRILTATL